MMSWRHVGRALSVLALGAALGVALAEVPAADAAPLTSDVRAETPRSHPLPASEAPQAPAPQETGTPSEALPEAHDTSAPPPRPAPRPALLPKPSAFGPVWVDLPQRVAVRRPVATHERRGALASRGGREGVRYERRVVPVDISPIICRHAALRRLDPHLVKAVIFAESRFRNTATSYCGAAGLMQLMPSTGRAMGARNLYDPEQNIAAGTRYLRLMLDLYGGNLTAAIAAYNAGPGNVPRSGAVPNITETRNYVRKVLKAYRGYKQAPRPAQED